MDPRIDSALEWFARIYLDGIPVLLQKNDTSFLSFLCVVAATDAIAGYRYPGGSNARFPKFIRNYFPSSYATHADNLYLFRCRMLHNFSPAYFSLVHATPADHLMPSRFGDTCLSDAQFFSDFSAASERYFAELRNDQSLQVAMLRRLEDIGNGGAIGVSTL